MRSEQAQSDPLPAWRIVRLRLDATGRAWLAAGIRGDRISVITLPECGPDETADSWQNRVEAAFEHGVQAHVGAKFG